MRELIEEVIVPISIICGLICGLILLAFVVLLSPIAFLDGSAKSAYLKKTQGIDIPWYQSTFLDVNVQDVNAKIKNGNNN